jgi:hypothetical protein
MKNYLLFVYLKHEAGGGIHDFKKAFETTDEAQEWCEENIKPTEPMVAEIVFFDGYRDGLVLVSGAYTRKNPPFEWQEWHCNDFKVQIKVSSSA